MGNSPQRAAGLATKRAARAAQTAATNSAHIPSAGVSGLSVRVNRGEGASEAMAHVFGRAL